MAEEARRRRQGHVEYLADLMSLEVSKRRERRIQRRTKDAKFPLLKTLEGFDFSKQPKLDQSDVLELFDGAFVEEARNVVLMGPVGIRPSDACVSVVPHRRGGTPGRTRTLDLVRGGWGGAASAGNPLHGAADFRPRQVSLRL